MGLGSRRSTVAKLSGREEEEEEEEVEGGKGGFRGKEEEGRRVDQN